jgi:hypothetical protein
MWCKQFGLDLDPLDRDKDLPEPSFEMVIQFLPTIHRMTNDEIQLWSLLCVEMIITNLPVIKKIGGFLPTTDTLEMIECLNASRIPADPREMIECMIVIVLWTATVAVLVNRAIKTSGMKTIGEEDQGTINVEVGTAITRDIALVESIEVTVLITVPTIWIRVTITNMIVLE